MQQHGSGLGPLHWGDGGCGGGGGGGKGGGIGDGGTSGGGGRAAAVPSRTQRIGSLSTEFVCAGRLAATSPALGLFSQPRLLVQGLFLGSQAAQYC